MHTSHIASFFQMQWSVRWWSHLAVDVNVDVGAQWRLLGDCYCRMTNVLVLSSTCRWQISMFCRTLRLSCRGDYKEGILAKDPACRLQIQLQGSYKQLQVANPLWLKSLTMSSSFHFLPFLFNIAISNKYSYYGQVLVVKSNRVWKTNSR